MASIVQSVVRYLLDTEHEVERYLLHDNKIDAMDAIPWVLNSAIIWTVLSLSVDKDPYFVSTIHAVFLSAAALYNLAVGHNEHEYLSFYVMTGYFVMDFFLHCLKPEFYIFGVHHAVTVFASYRMINQRNWNETMFASSCWLVELSTPFLNHYKVHKSMAAAMMFALTFFIFRVLWLSRLSYTGWQVAINRLEFGIIVIFTLLNYYWFWEIAREGIEMFTKKTEKAEKVHLPAH